MVAVHFISASMAPDHRSPTRMASVAAKGTVPPLFFGLCGMKSPLLPLATCTKAKRRGYLTRHLLIISVASTAKASTPAAAPASTACVAPPMPVVPAPGPEARAGVFPGT